VPTSDASRFCRASPPCYERAQGTRTRGLRFSKIGESDDECLSFGSLESWATGIAALPQAQVTVGGRALLVMPPGAAHAAALFGCFFAGVAPPCPSTVPVPRLHGPSRRGPRTWTSRHARI
jgi:acyl-CoA synthetase (AMP-forming)/AMP-acid ligase II